MSMYDDKNWEFDAFADADYSRHSLAELVAVMESICKVIEEEIVCNKEKIEKINSDYSSVLQRYFEKGDIRDYFKEPLKLLQLTAEELTEILDEIKKDKVNQAHIRRLKYLGEEGAKDFNEWIESLHPQMGDVDLMLDVSDLMHNIGTTAAGIKVMKKIAGRLEIYIDCKLRSKSEQDKKTNLRATKGSKSIDYRNLITSVYDASPTSLRYGDGKEEMFNGKSQLGDLWYFLLSNIDKKIPKKQVMTNVNLSEKEALRKIIENLIDKLVRVSHLPRSEVKSWFEIKVDTLCLKS